VKEKIIPNAQNKVIFVCAAAKQST